MDAHVRARADIFFVGADGIYGEDVTHIVTEEGIANLLRCRDTAEREQAIRGVAGYTEVGRGRDEAMVELRARRDPPARGSRNRSARCRPWPAGGPFDQGSRPLVGQALRAAGTVSQLVRGRPVMEELSFRCSARECAGGTNGMAIVGAVASGNLEVLAERALPGTECLVEIWTAARGFGRVWDAVVTDFVERHRVRLLLDAGSFVEFIGPTNRVVSPHLAMLDLPEQFDDGIVVVRGRPDGKRVPVAAHEGRFMGGAFGEVHAPS